MKYVLIRPADAPGTDLMNVHLRAGTFPMAKGTVSEPRALSDFDVTEARKLGFGIVFKTEAEHLASLEAAEQAKNPKTPAFSQSQAATSIQKES